MPSLEEVLQKVYSDTPRGLVMLQKNYQGTYTVYPVRGNLTTDGVQWSDEVSASATATTVTVFSSTIDAPGIDQIIDEVKFSLEASLMVTTSTATTISFLWQAKDSANSTWTNISTARKLHTTSYTASTLSGYFETVSNFNQLPFNLRLAMRTGTANRGKAKVKNSTYVTVKSKKSWG